MKHSNIVALDIGNVCITLNPEPSFGFFGLKPWTPLPEPFNSACDRLEKGTIDEEEWMCAYEEVSGHRYSRVELMKVWNTMIGEPVPGMEELIRTYTQKGVRFVYFSNTSDLHMMEVARRNSFAHLITGGVYSFTAHAKKPDPVIYEAFEKIYGIPCAYFDDLPGNVEAGLKRGWNAHVFHTAEDLKAVLEELF